jgi:hypothetical protein
MFVAFEIARMDSATLSPDDDPDHTAPSGNRTHRKDNLARKMLSETPPWFANRLKVGHWTILLSCQRLDVQVIESE